jgi:hypothetical protein
MITWLSTKSSIRMLDQPIDRVTEEHLRENQGIDSALLATDLSIGPAHVEALQRRLGLRKCVPPGRKRR